MKKLKKLFSTSNLRKFLNGFLILSLLFGFVLPYIAIESHHSFIEVHETAN